MVEHASQHPIGRAITAAALEHHAHGDPAVLVAWDDRARAVLVVADTIKPTSAPTPRSTPPT